MDNEELGDKCDHDPCHCVPDPSVAVADGKRIFCSPGCADGKGCGHEHCDCASVKT